MVINLIKATIILSLKLDGWEAFMAAHINMNKIQASMELVPKNVQTALQVLISRRSTPRIIGNLLPSTLREIERLGQSCVALANNTHLAFAKVMSLIGEVISMTETTRGLQETRLRQTEIELNVSRVMQGEMTKLSDTIRSHYNEARETARQAQNEYSKALRKIPTGFKSLLLDLGRAAISMGKAAATAMMASATGGASLVAGALSGLGSGATSGGQQAGETSVATGQSLTFGKLFSGSLQKALPSVKRFLGDIKGALSSMKNPTEEFDAYKITFETFLASMKTGKSNRLKQRATGLIERGIDLFGRLGDETKKSMANGKEINSNLTRDFQDQFEQLNDEAKPMAAAEEMNGGGVPPAPPQLSASGDSSTNEKFAAQLSMNRLRDAETRYDQIFGQLKQNQEELAKLMGKIASLDMTRIYYKEILELLREALHLLSRVREQWSQLVLFFAEVATRAEISLSGTLTPFVTQATQAGDQSLTLDERMFYVDILKAQANEIDVQSQMLYTMSRTYVDMSTRYVIGRLAGLSKMLTARDDAERNSFLVQLTRESNDTQRAVSNLVIERKNLYQAAIRKRRTELEKFIETLGGADPSNQAAIEAGQKLLN